jgi:hypothetical protein
MGPRCRPRHAAEPQRHSTLEPGELSVETSTQLGQSGIEMLLGVGETRIPPTRRLL